MFRSSRPSARGCFCRVIPIISPSDGSWRVSTFAGAGNRVPSQTGQLSPPSQAEAFQTPFRSNAGNKAPAKALAPQTRSPLKKSQSSSRNTYGTDKDGDRSLAQRFACSAFGDERRSTLQSANGTQGHAPRDVRNDAGSIIVHRADAGGKVRNDEQYE